MVSGSCCWCTSGYCYHLDGTGIHPSLSSATVDKASKIGILKGNCGLKRTRTQNLTERAVDLAALFSDASAGLAALIDASQSLYSSCRLQADYRSYRIH